MARYRYNYVFNDDRHLKRRISKLVEKEIEQIVAEIIRKEVWVGLSHKNLKQLEVIVGFNNKIIQRKKLIKDIQGDLEDCDESYFSEVNELCGALKKACLKERKLQSKFAKKD